MLVCSHNSDTMVYSYLVYLLYQCVHVWSMIYGFLYGLPHRCTLRMHYSIEDTVHTVMSDGVTLTASVFTPTGETSRIHTILIRTPYGRRLLAGLGCIFAQVGYRVVCQDTRGRWSSEGTYESSLLGYEKTDGRDTIKWIQKQYPESKIGMMGISYLGYVQWAAVSGLIEENGSSDDLACIVPMACSSDMFSSLFTSTGCVPSIDFLTRWVLFTSTVGRNRTTAGVRDVLSGLFYMGKTMLGCSPMVPACSHVDHINLKTTVETMLTEAGEDVGSNLPFDQCRPDDLFWRERSHTDGVSLAPSCHLISGWYDVFLEGVIRDFHLLRLTDSNAQLTIGPWHHLQTMHPGPFGLLLRSTLSHFRTHLQPCRQQMEDVTDAPSSLPVRVFLPASPSQRWGASVGHVLQTAAVSAGSLASICAPGQWVALSSWPPVETTLVPMWMASDGGLVPKCDSTPTPGQASYSFDSSDPTPSSGVDGFHLYNAGPFRIHKDVHDRTDAVHFTSDVFTQGIVLAGHVSAVLQCCFEGAESVDYVVRLCEVYPDGTSVVVAEGIERVTTYDSMPVRVDIGSIGRIVAPGNSIRVYICSSAYPRWMVNSGYIDETTPQTPTVSRHQVRCAPGSMDASYLLLPVYPLAA